MTVSVSGPIVADSRQAAQVQRVQVIDVPHQADNRPGHAPAHEGVAAGRPYPVDDAVDFRFSGLRRHHHDHLVRLQLLLHKESPGPAGPGLS
jgi:hypothetical protein